MGHDASCGCREYQMVSRRRFLSASGGLMAAMATAPAWMPRVAFGAPMTAGRDIIISIYLRGGADGLVMCAPFGEALYHTLRPGASVLPPDASDPTFRAVDLNGFFGLPPALAPLQEPYLNGHMAVVHATGSNDPTRSHFDAQRYMEVGEPGNNLLYTGWLGRHLATVNPMRPDGTIRGMGVAYGVQRTLVGAADVVPAPDPANYGLTGSGSTESARLAHLGAVYQSAEPVLAQAAADTLATVALLNQVNAGAYVPPPGLDTIPYPTSTFGKSMKAAAALIRADAGVEAIAIDRGGWDTHASQGAFTPAGTMYGLMNDLAMGLSAFYRDIIMNSSHSVVIVVMSEFGRRLQLNGSGGTDHGHGNCMFVLGHKVAGGQVYGAWPTLAAPYQNLDLQVTTDYRHVLAEIVQERLGNSNLAAVFPGFVPAPIGVTQ